MTSNSNYCRRNLNETSKNRNRVGYQLLVPLLSKSFSLFYFLTFLLIALPLTSAAPPVSGTTALLERGIDVIYPEIFYVNKAHDLEINFWTYNSTDGQTLTNRTLNCTFYLIDNKGVQYYRLSSQPGASGLITYSKGAPLCVNCWTAIIPSSSLALGLNAYQAKCQGPGIGGEAIGTFEVTYSGLADNSLLISLLLISAFLILILAVFLKNEYVGIIASMLFVIAGVYIMAYGIGPTYDMYSQALAFICLGLGLFIFISAAYDVINKDSFTILPEDLED
jgi:hypothetical protein